MSVWLINCTPLPVTICYAKIQSVLLKRNISEYASFGESFGNFLARLWHYWHGAKISWLNTNVNGKQLTEEQDPDTSSYMSEQYLTEELNPDTSYMIKQYTIDRRTESWHVVLYEWTVHNSQKNRIPTRCLIWVNRTELTEEQNPNTSYMNEQNTIDRRTEPWHVVLYEGTVHNWQKNRILTRCLIWVKRTYRRTESWHVLHEWTEHNWQKNRILTCCLIWVPVVPLTQAFTNRTQILTHIKKALVSIPSVDRLLFHSIMLQLDFSFDLILVC